MTPMHNPEFLEQVVDKDLPLVQQLELIARYENVAQQMGYLIMEAEE